MATPKKSRYATEKYTAFQTAFGVYEWNRVPMGLKGAPSYFQHVMQTEVLDGLMYEVCELYIDDEIIFANSADDMVENLKRVLQRLSEFNITVSPDKYSFGLEVIEFVGHTLDFKILHFTRTKLNRVLDIALPTTSKQLKSFLGVCIFFSEHIHGYADKTKPLHNMLMNYEPKRKRFLQNSSSGWRTWTPRYKRTQRK